MKYFPDSIEELISQLGKLPGIGRKSAQRLALGIVEMDKEDAFAISRAITDVKRKVRYCSNCFNFTDDALCEVCASSKRDKATICVVDTPRDLMAIERTREYKGTYHVLHGRISPLDGIGPDDIRIRELLERLKGNEVKEIILANSPTVEGEATAIYLSKLIGAMGFDVTRIAHGVPIGGDLEYADEITLLKAIEGRHKL